jgi:lipopolysaccharide export system permease protein
MTTCTRYIVAELLKVLSLWLGVFTLVFVFSLLAVEFRRGGISPAVLLRILPYIVPQALVFALPATVLLAVCVVYGRIAASNEIVALKSLGISPRVLVWPACVLAFLLSLLCLQFNEFAVTWGERGLRRVVMQSLEEILYGTLRTHQTYSTDRLSIIVQDVIERRLIRPVITFHSHEGSSPFSITADEAELTSNLQNDTLVLTLVNSVIDGGGSLQGVFPGRTEREIPLTFASAKGDLELSSTQRPLREIAAGIADQQRKVKRVRQLLAADLAMNLVTGELHELNEHRWGNLRHECQLEVNRLHRLRLEPWRRWSTSFMCLFFTIVGIPMAILRRNNDFMSTFALCFLPILFGYFPLFFTVLNYAKDGTLPPPLLWLANALCVIVGWRFWQKVERY